MVSLYNLQTAGHLQVNTCLLRFESPGQTLEQLGRISQHAVASY